MVRSIFRALNKQTPICPRNERLDAKIPLASKGNPFSFPSCDRYRRYEIERNLQAKSGGFSREKKLIFYYNALLFIDFHSRCLAFCFHGMRQHFEEKYPSLTRSDFPKASQTRSDACRDRYLEPPQGSASAQNC